MVRESSEDFYSLEIYAQASEIFCPPNLLGGIRYCCRVALFLCCHLASFFGLLILPKGLLFSWGSEILVGAATRLAIDFLVSLLNAFLSSLSEMKKVSWYLFPDIRQTYFGDRLSYSLCRGGYN